MNGTAFMSINKLSGNGRLLQAARHNRRTLTPEVDIAGSINTERSHLNETLFGPATPEGVAALAKELMNSALGHKTVRKDAILGIELLFSLPLNHRLSDDRSYFARCVEWTADELGGICIITA